MAANIIVGDDGSNTLSGTTERDVIYGFDPNGPQGNVSVIAATRVASGLSVPLFATAPPGDTGRLFIVEKTGAIRILDLNTGQVLPTPFLTVAVDSTGERGLLGLAFDPDYSSNGFFYIYRTVPGSPPHNVVDRYHVSANPNVADPTSASTVINLGNLSSAANHNAGWIGFGTDNYLYIATGENANGLNSQTLSNLLGKVLRIDVHSGSPYSIPDDNPFVGIVGAREEIFSLGLRNPFRNSFDRVTGDFFIADVGENTIEEINFGIKGANYGWPDAEGPSGNPAFTNPIFSYNHSVGRAVIGGYVYRGTSDGLQGQYFLADEVTGRVFTLRLDGSTWVSTERTSQITASGIRNPTSFGEDGRGDLYVTDANGSVFRLTPIVSSADLADNLSGNGGDDVLYGGTGNDLLNGGEGDDVMNGGAGIDIASFSGLKAEYSITRSGNTLHVSGPDGTDLLTGIETLVFADGTVHGFGSEAMDLSGDFASDLLWRHTSGTFSEWQSNGDSFTSNVFVGSVENGWHLEGAFDFSGDGRADLIWRNDTTGQFTIWNSTESGFTPNSYVNGASPVWTIAALGDFNGDGFEDMIFRNTTSGTFSVWQSTGAGFTANVFVGSVDNTWHLTAAADFSGDGRIDLLWRNDNGTLSEWQSNGSGFTPNVHVASVDTAWQVLGTGDFNGDGRADLLFRHDTGTFTEWQSIGNGFTPNVFVGGVSNDWQLAQAGDFNGDGKDDLLWRNTNGTFTEWQSTGNSFTPNVVVGSVASDWSVITHQYDLV